MAIARITWQDATNISVLTTVTATYPGATTAWNLLIACFTYDTGYADGVISTSGWLQGSFDIAVNGLTGGGIWYKVADWTETTVTASAADSSNMSIAIYEYEGFVGTPTLDKAMTWWTISGTSTTTGTTATTTANDEVAIVISQYIVTSTFTSWSNSFNLLNTVTWWTQRMSTGDKILSSTGTQTSTITISWSSYIGAGIATFKWVASASNPWFVSFFFN